ncbi:MAG: cation-translocating P-type ATPase [archaeon]|nr:cation-translocating P-type ATPase [archaeon]
METKEVFAHSLEVNDVEKELDTSIEKGLSEEEVKKRIEKYGLNELEQTKKISAWEIFINQFKDFLIYLLFFAIAISIGIGIYEAYQGHTPESFVDALVIFVILIINAVLGFYQEYQAEKALESLKKMAPHHAKVIRNGIVKEIDVKDVVIGDILQLDEGDKIPADARLTKAFSMYVDEAILTGESQPVNKNLQIYDKKTALADRKNSIYSSTIITRGTGGAIVTATGMTTEIGKIAGKIQELEPEPSPFSIEIDRFGKSLGKLIVLICVIVFCIEIALIVIEILIDPMITGLHEKQIEEIINAFKMSISLAVSAVPEGLVVVITVVMSIGMQKMAKRNALVKNLTAVETLGRVNIICSDKTGTLTKNEMTVVKVFCDGKIYDVEGVGYALEGKINESGAPVAISSDLERYLQVCLLCNNSSVVSRNDGTKNTDVVGDPTEISLKVLAMKMDLASKAEKIDEIPFNSDRKMMSVVMKMDNQLYAFIKGAPDIMMKKAGKALLNGEERPIEEARELILNQNDTFAKNALRVLGIGYKLIDEGYSEDDIEEDFTYLGLAGIIDPARDEVKDSIIGARNAGIRTIMITGDHKITAIAIAKQIGLTDKDTAITGAELDEMSEQELDERVKDTDVFARVTSEHKLRILKRLKAAENVVSMTGDGVNDAPAVKGAHIGVAMGLKGTEVTQEASDMILIDDNYSTIVNAIEEGRGIFNTTKGFFRFMLSTNFDEILLILIAWILMKFIPTVFFSQPIEPIQILWLNIVTDGIPAMALGFTPTDPDLMKFKPRKGFNMIKDIKGGIIFGGILSAVTDVALYLCCWTIFIPYWSTFDPRLAGYTIVGSSANIYAIGVVQTIILTNLILFELMYVFSCTSEYKPMWLFPNKKLFLAVGTSLGLYVLIILFPPLRSAFSLVLLDQPHYWLAIFSGCIWILPGEELRKYLIRRKMRE